MLEAAPLISESVALVSSFELCLAQTQSDVSQPEMFLWVFMSVLKPHEFAQVFSRVSNEKRRRLVYKLADHSSPLLCQS